MKSKWIVAGVLAGVVACSTLAQVKSSEEKAAARAPVANRVEKTTEKTNELTIFMRQKLMYSEKIVEGIALEDYSMVRTNSHKLCAMSKENNWFKVGQPDFLEKTAAFQLITIKLADAARDKDTPAMLNAYGEVIHSCVDCHQMFRRAQYVRVSDNPARKLN